MEGRDTAAGTAAEEEEEEDGRALEGRTLGWPEVAGLSLRCGVLLALLLLGLAGVGWGPLFWNLLMSC